MPLQPNILERFLISRGEIPGLLLDGGMSIFQFWAVVGAARIGLFKPLHSDGPLSVSELTRRTDAEERALERLVHVLEPLGYLDRTDDGYALSDAARRSLPVQQLPELVPVLEFMMKECENVDRALREAPEDGIIGWEPVQTGRIGRSYQALMRWIASQSVDEVVETVDLPEGAERMLDVGGSHGLYTVGFCREHPRLEGTVLDWEIGLENARQTLDEHPDVAPRIDLLERDFEKEELPGGYDFAFLGQIVHGIGPEGNRKLFRKLASATTEIGTVAILDQLAGVSGSRFGRAIAGLLGFNLFLFSGGRNYEYDRLRRWLDEAGFPHLTRHSLQQPGYSLLVARKQPAPGWGARISRWLGT